MRRAAPILVALLALLAALPARGAFPQFTQATAKLKLTAAQPVTNNTTFTILFGAGTEFWKNNVTHSTVSNTGRLTVVTPGKYDVIAYVDWATSATSDRRVVLNHYNSSNVNLRQTYNYIGPVGGSLDADMTVHAVFNAVATDYFTLDVAQFSGGNLNANAGSSLSCVLMGAP